MIKSVRYDESDSFELRADDLTVYGRGEAVVLLRRRTWSQSLDGVWRGGRNRVNQPTIWMEDEGWRRSCFRPVRMCSACVPRDLKANSGINGLIRQGEGCGAGAGCQKEE